MTDFFNLLDDIDWVMFLLVMMVCGGLWGLLCFLLSLIDE